MIEIASALRRTIVRGKVTALVFLAWTALALMSCLKGAVMARVAGQRVDWPDLVLQHGPWWYSWALLTPVVVLLAAHFRLDEPRGRWIAITIHVAAAFVLASAHVLGLGALFSATGHVWLHMTRASAIMRSWYEIYLVPDMVTYAVIAGIYYAMDFGRRWRESVELTSALRVQGVTLRRQQVEAQLDALRMELNPHFLFNTLNSSITLVQQGDSDTAVMMLLRLSDLLRATLRRNDAKEITFRQEMTLVTLYLDIERVRFADRLSVAVCTDVCVEGCLVPPLILQPLVENAIRYGIANREGAGVVRIDAHRENDQLRIDVTDESHGARTTPLRKREMGFGVGLANVRDRLETMYGGEAGIALMERPESGALASIWMPFRVESRGITNV